MTRPVSVIVLLGALIACKQAEEKPTAPAKVTENKAALIKAMRGDVCPSQPKHCPLDPTLEKVFSSKLTERSDKTTLDIDMIHDGGGRAEAYRVCHWAHRQYPSAVVTVKFFNAEDGSWDEQYSYATIRNGGC